MLDVIENLPATVTLLKLACARSLRRVLLVSSGGTVYGNPTYLPIDESHTTNPVSPYGITKLAAEKYAMLFHQLAGLPVTVVRPSNPYGPHQYGNSGQGFVGALLFAALNRIPVRIFGTRGTVRDYIYIEDLSEGLIAALEFGQAGEIYNIGTGIGLDNQSVVEELNRILDPIHGDIQVIRESPRPFDVRANILDAAKLIRISGWKPRTDFRAGLSVTLEWAVKHALLSQQ